MSTPTDAAIERAYRIGFCLKLAQQGLRPSEVSCKTAGEDGSPSFKLDDELVQWVSRPLRWGVLSGLGAGALWGLHSPSPGPVSQAPKELKNIQHQELVQQLKSDTAAMQRLLALAKDRKKITRPSPYGI